jgi:hypothetical protein
MSDGEGIIPDDEVPEADAAEQRQAIDLDDETGLDTAYLSDAGARDANEADVIEQALVIPAPDDDWDGDR